MIDVEEKLEQTYLYDFYGELLNEHQRRIYENIVFDDLSLGEIASENGISRQGVADMMTEEFRQSGNGQLVEQINAISNKILEEL